MTMGNSEKSSSSHERVTLCRVLYGISDSSWFIIIITVKIDYNDGDEIGENDYYNQYQKKHKHKCFKDILVGANGDPLLLWSNAITNLPLLYTNDEPFHQSTEFHITKKCV